MKVSGYLIYLYSNNKLTDKTNHQKELIFDDISRAYQYLRYCVYRGQLPIYRNIEYFSIISIISLIIDNFVVLKVRQSINDMQNMFDLTAIKPTVANTSVNAPNLIIDQSTASIVFDKVRFKYPDNRELFTELSFEVPAGKKIAIVGGSGSGKSTIVRLLYRFYDPVEGRVLINGQDIKNVNLDSLQRAIGIVPQDTVLFNDTILHNIHYGNKPILLKYLFQQQICIV